MSENTPYEQRLWSELWDDLPVGDVSHDRALGIPAILKGVRLIAGSVSRTPIKVYRRRGDGSRDRVRTHPAERLLRHWSAPGVSALSLKRHLTAEAVLKGNGYARIERDEDATPIALHPLNGEDVDAVLDLETGTRGYVWHRPTTAGTVPTPLAFSDVFHVSSPITGSHGWIGRSLISLAQETLSGIASTEKFTRAYYDNSGRPNLIVMMPGTGSYKGETLERAESTRKAWIQKYAGAEKAHQTAFLPQGSEIETLDTSPALGGLASLRELGLVDVANLLGIPASFVNASVNTSYKSLTEDSKNLVQYGLADWFSSWESAATLLLGEKDRLSGRLYAEFQREELYRADTDSVAESLLKQVAGGIMTVAEARQVLNRPPLPGPEPKPEPEPEPEADPEPEPEVKP